MGRIAWSDGVIAGLLLAAGVAHGADPATVCKTDKMRRAGLYDLCLLKAHAKAVKTGSALDVSRCEAQFGAGWAKAEAKAGGACPNHRRRAGRRRAGESRRDRDHRGAHADDNDHKHLDNVDDAAPVRDRLPRMRWRLPERPDLLGHGQRSTARHVLCVSSGGRHALRSHGRSARERTALRERVQRARCARHSTSTTPRCRSRAGACPRASRRASASRRRAAAVAARPV